MAEERSATEAATAAFRKGGWADNKLAGKDGKEKPPRMRMSSASSMRSSGGGSSGGGGDPRLSSALGETPGPRISSASAASGRSSKGPIRRGSRAEAMDMMSLVKDTAGKAAVGPGIY